MLLFFIRREFNNRSTCWYFLESFSCTRGWTWSPLFDSICVEKNWEQERKRKRIRWKRHQKESDKEQVEERNNLIVIATTIIQQARDTHMALKGRLISTWLIKLTIYILLKQGHLYKALFFVFGVKQVELQATLKCSKLSFFSGFDRVSNERAEIELGLVLN